MVPGVRAVPFGHMGDGNIHLIPFFSFAEWNALPDREDLTELVEVGRDGAFIRLTNRGVLLSNEVFQEFLHA